MLFPWELKVALKSACSFQNSGVMWNFTCASMLKNTIKTFHINKTMLTHNILSFFYAGVAFYSQEIWLKVRIGDLSYWAWSKFLALETQHFLPERKRTLLTGDIRPQTQQIDPFCISTRVSQSTCEVDLLFRSCRLSQYFSSPKNSDFRHVRN